MSTRKIRRWGRGLASVLTAAGVAVLVLVAAAPAQEGPVTGMEKAAEGLVAAGVTVGDLDLSGLDEAGVRSALTDYASRPVTIAFRGESRRYAPETLGAQTDVERAVTAVLDASAGTRVGLAVEVDGKSLRRWAHRVAGQFARPAGDSEIVLRGQRPRITRSSFGREVRQGQLRAAAASALRASGRERIQLPVRVLRPEVTQRNAGRAIVILRDSNELTLFAADGRRRMKVQRQFRVATGQASNPTPLGSFTIVDMQRDPWWYPPDSDWAQGKEPVPPGPGNPLGTRWMGLSEPLIGIHGTPDAASIGYSASRGCIRMFVPDAEWLFERVEEGTPVFILGE
ncbi:MAG TPA: L,D-transpeptidase family protein [Gaiellaceae bacterium]|nr:L,D-transpeptidase family protein [Gaiellaceae bacterium]